MNAARRRPRPARQDWERRGEILTFYISLYASDPDFQQGLLDLYEAHCTGQEQFLANARDLWTVYEATWPDWLSSLPNTEWAQDYLDAIAELAERFGLQRLARPKPASNRDFRPSGGEQLIHKWCSGRAMASLSGHDWPPSLFISGADYGGGRPEVGEVVLREEIPVGRSGEEGLVIVDERREPLVHVRIEDAWDPRVETHTKARERLLVEAKRQIDTELARIVADAEGRGYTFSDSEETGRDLVWLFWKARYRLSYSEIVQRSNLEHPEWLRRALTPDIQHDPILDTERVKKAVVRMAQRVGIDRTGWGR